MVVWVIWQGIRTIACWIFSPGKTKKVRMVTQMFRLLDIFLNAFSYCYAFLSCFSICFFLKVLLWRLCFSKNVIFSFCACICFFGAVHFIHSLPLHTFCSGCLVIVVNKVFWASGLQQHFN